MNLLQRSLFVLMFLLAGCAHSVHMVHMSDFTTPGRKGKMVSAKSEQFVVFFFAFDTQYVDDAYEKLMAQCPDGKLVGISTEYMTNLGFLSWTNRIYMKGRCIAAGEA